MSSKFTIMSILAIKMDGGAIPPFSYKPISLKARLSTFSGKHVNFVTYRTRINRRKKTEPV